MEDAMSLSTAKLAFIHASDTDVGQSATWEMHSRPAEDQEVREPRQKASRQDVGRPDRRHRSLDTSSADRPRANEILDGMLVPVTIRLTHRTAQALKRAALEQKLNHRKPDQVQGISELAIAEWLRRSGFIDK
jgi:hypothetical protein